MNVPESLRYTSDHEWILVEGDIVTVGITDHAQEELTDVVFVELPEVGREAMRGDAIAVVESVKAASDVYAPIAGTVVAVNEVLADEPETVNSDPYGEGWIVRMQPTGDIEGLMSPDEYQQLLDDLED